MNEDQHILKQYVRDGSRDALDQIIRRYQNLVYSAALRQVRDPHLAEDVTQAVFIVLSRKANTIREGVAIGGWLLAVTRRASVDAMRKRANQYRHEHAAARAEASTNQASEWDQIAPVIDEAMSHLSSKDRDAVTLRYFEDQPFARVGQVMSISEAAARKRVGRALERLRGLLSRRGATLGVAALGTMITANAVHASPVTMTISTTAATSGAMGIAKGAIHMMAWAKAKAAAIVALTSLLVVSGGTVVVTYALAQQQPAAVAGDQPTINDDHIAIQGTWQLITQMRNGQSAPAGAPTASMQMVITDKQILASTAGNAASPMSYSIDPSHQPKWIDLKTANGNSSPGIYELDGDSLQICTPSANNNTRPTEFVSQADGANRTLLILHRGVPTTQAAAPRIPSDPKVVAAKSDVANLETALDAFEIDTGHYPTGADGLNALQTAPLGVTKWRGPYVRRVPQDPWGNSYRYLAPGIHNKVGFDVWSSGPDGIDMTADDIGNWKP